MNIKDKLDRYAPASDLSNKIIGNDPPHSAECEHLTNVFPMHYRQSGLYVDELGGEFNRAAAMLIPDRSLGELDFSKIAFVDTETTGLSGGSGVCAFLVAIGYLSSDGFVVDQYLMNDFPAEPELLRNVIEKLEGFDVIASYNGRAFDIPLLDTRFLLNSMQVQLAGRPQLDLLHPSRRIWKHRLRGCSLKSIEANVLDFWRIDDIDGWLIPETYFEFLRTGNRELLEPVINHNQLDVLSLAFIAQIILNAVEAPEEAQFAYGLDWYGLGTLFEKYRRRKETARCFERAMELDLPEEARPKCMRQLSLTHKRQGDWDSAVNIWNEETGVDDETHNLFALEELAKYYEHRARDLDGARDACRRAITMLEFRSATSISDLSHHFERFEYRLQRIERKIRRRNA
jgi:uncharacterized protein YprB with RNaseH-like and TPR domain